MPYGRIGGDGSIEAYRPLWREGEQCPIWMAWDVGVDTWLFIVLSHTKSDLADLADIG